MTEQVHEGREFPIDKRGHVESMLMRESLLDKQVMSSTESPVVPMLPFCHVIKIGGRSIIDQGKKAVYSLVDALARILENFKLVIGTGGGVRSRHVTSIGMISACRLVCWPSFGSSMRSEMRTSLAHCWRHTASSPSHPKSSGTCCPSSSDRPQA